MEKFKVFVTVMEKRSGVMHWNKTILVLDGNKKELSDLTEGLKLVKKNVKEHLFDKLFHQGFVQKMNELSIEVEF